MGRHLVETAVEGLAAFSGGAGVRLRKVGEGNA